jgi:hypothetical protein
MNNGTAIGAENWIGHVISKTQLLDALRGQWPVTMVTLPKDELVEICEGSESTAELLQDKLRETEQIDGTINTFCDIWADHFEDTDSDHSPGEQWENNFEWGRELYLACAEVESRLNQV